MIAPTKPRPVIVALALGILTLVPILGFLAVEAGARAIVWWQHGVPGHSYGIYTFHPVLKGILAPLGYNAGGKVTNGQRFQRLGEIADSPPADRTRVVFYGGSTTFAYNLPTGRDWPNLVERAAEAAGRKLEALNAGDISWTIHHAMIRSREDLPRFKPDVVVFYEGLNEEANYEQVKSEGIDVEAMMRAGDYSAFSTDLTQCSWLHRNLFLAKLSARILAPAIEGVLGIGPEDQERKGNERVDPYPEVTAFFLGAVGRAVDAWKSQGARVIYVIQAQGKNTVGALRQATYSRAGADVARTHGALVIDAQEIVRAYKGNTMDLFTPTGFHWEGKGTDMMARFVFEKVEALDGWRIERRSKP